MMGLNAITHLLGLRILRIQTIDNRTDTNPYPSLQGELTERFCPASTTRSTMFDPESIQKGYMGGRRDGYNIKSRSKQLW